MKVELYTRDSQGKCEVVGEVYKGLGPRIGASITCPKGIKYKILNCAIEYDRHGNLEGCSVEVKPA